MAGHVFIIRGELQRLACDTWLVSTSARARPQDNWFLPDYTGPRNGVPFVDGGPRVQSLKGLPPDQPQPWLGYIGAAAQKPSWYVDGAVEFAHAAAEAIVNAGKPPLFDRAKSLLALPIVGTGKGGAAEQAGEVVQELLPQLENFVAKRFQGDREFDVVLVCKRASSYAAAQAERVHRKSWPIDLTDAQRKEADLLAQHALAGRLALFLGAGISIAAGLPSWHDLLKTLAQEAGMSDKECQALSDLKNAMDQATIIERRWHERGAKLGPAVKEELGRRKHYALTHALLAALPVREVITTNYDQLFDEAWKLTDPDGLSILPGDIKPNTRRWLLKMHGCLSDPDKIVLTRASYTRYDEQLPALAGIVQAFLVTRHVLFVGFSLTDDNFHRIVDAVRRLLNSTGLSKQIGTSLTLGHGGLAEVLWDKDLHRVRMDERQQTNGFPRAEAARRLEIFLDYLLSRTRNTAHLLEGNRFNANLTPGERRLRDALNRFLKELEDGDPQQIRETVAWSQIERLLVNLGFESKKLPLGRMRRWRKIHGLRKLHDVRRSLQRNLGLRRACGPISIRSLSLIPKPAPGCCPLAVQELFSSTGREALTVTMYVPSDCRWRSRQAVISSSSHSWAATSKTRARWIACSRDNLIPTVLRVSMVLVACGLSFTGYTRRQRTLGSIAMLDAGCRFFGEVAIRVASKIQLVICSRLMRIQALAFRATSWAKSRTSRRSARPVRLTSACRIETASRASAQASTLRPMRKRISARRA